MRYTTAKDGGSADFAGAKYLPAHPWAYAHRLPGSMRYTAHPWA